MGEVKQRGILFSAPMIEAIQAGRKFQTRRVVKPQPPDWLTSGRVPWNIGGNLWGWAEDFSNGARACLSENTLRCPYGEPGDLLYVKEGHAITGGAPDDYPEFIYRSDREAFQFSSPGSRCDSYYLASDYEPKRWISPLFMPRWAARLWLRITGVRIERLQSITDDDARAEGFPLPGPQKTRQTVRYPDGREETSIVDAHFFDAKHNFVALWEHINDKPGERWADNPYVWRVAFERCEAPQ